MPTDRTAQIAAEHTERVASLARTLAAHGGVRINTESYGGPWGRERRAADKADLRAAAKLAGLRVRVTEVAGYFITAQVSGK